jgi:uncharacterized membrane protein
MRKTIFILISFLAVYLFSFNITFAQDYEVTEQPFEETLEGEVAEVLKDVEIQDHGEDRLYQELRISITSGSLEGKDIKVKNGEFPTANIVRYKIGDKLVINHSKDMGGNDIFLISDFVRRDSLLLLFVIFALVAIAVGKVWGLSSIAGMAFSFLIIFKFILPQIINGSDPVFIAIIGSVFIIPVTFYLSHGFNNKTHIAILGTLISLVLTGILASVFVETSKLTGFASEEAGFLHYEKRGMINMKGLLLAGIMIGTLGILDDVTVSQSAIVYQLKGANKRLRFGELYSRAMKVGHDHVSSMVNTLVLVYTGAALPLLLLFINNPKPFSEVINYEIIADEIVRTLVGSIGLILAVPITTFIAATYISRNESKKSNN